MTADRVAEGASADRAVAYLLRRLQDDPRLAYYFPMTESLALLTAAYAETHGLDVETFRREYDATLRTMRPICNACREPVED